MEAHNTIADINWTWMHKALMTVNQDNFMSLT